MFDLSRLRVLHAVAGHGSLAAAAQALHLTPSAVSQAMAKLEREAGCVLAERQGRRLRLTEEGHVLASHADRILAAVAAASADLDERKGLVIGEVTIGAFPTAARGLVPAVLRSCAARYPALRIRLLEVEPYQSMGRVASGDLDLAVTQDWMNLPVAVPERLDSTDIGLDHADIALPVGHPLADRASIALPDLATEPWIASTAGTICHDWLTTTFRRAGHEPLVAHQAAEFPTQLALVAAGLGVAVVPRLAADSVPRGVVLVPVTPALHRRVFAVWREETGRRPAIRAVVGALREAAEPMGLR
ncbi:LysR family transcriptional regulator [Actinophytocola oryzae]|uniref:DNA-binding transcriptional LysR family regulator n=1 Tax=Actinophytocola oryzae TaxID=502181 RepID=A0A4R7VWS1_9PSEU|nr:LysR family transcriptional regulator [Actinophytocola oryzae]TDV54098.1 DNA-binding transcriptional LysR family regulator [Actinophytocola oryzae]